MYYLGTDFNQYIVFLDFKLYNIWIHSIIHTKSIFSRISSAQLGILNVPKSDHILIHLQLIEKSSQAVKQSHVKTMSQFFCLIKGMLQKVLWLAKPWVNSKHSSGNNDIICTPLDFIYFLCEFNIYWCRYMSPFCTLQTHHRLSFCMMIMFVYVLTDVTWHEKFSLRKQKKSACDTNMVCFLDARM